VPGAPQLTQVERMTSRRLLILGIAALLIIVAGVWLAGRESSTGPGVGTGALYPGLKEELNAVNAIRLYKAGDARVVELVRKDDVWKVSERDNYPADDGKLRKLLIAIADAKTAEQKTADPQQYATLGVEDTKGSGATSLRIELVGTQKPVDLIVGKEAVGGRANYVRRAGEPQSWLIDTTIDTERPSSPRRPTAPLERRNPARLSTRSLDWPSRRASSEDRTGPRLRRSRRRPSCRPSDRVRSRPPSSRADRYRN